MKKPRFVWRFWHKEDPEKRNFASLETEAKEVVSTNHRYSSTFSKEEGEENLTIWATPLQKEIGERLIELTTTDQRYMIQKVYFTLHSIEIEKYFDVDWDPLGIAVEKTLQQIFAERKLSEPVFVNSFKKKAVATA